MTETVTITTGGQGTMTSMVMTTQATIKTDMTTIPTTTERERTCITEVTGRGAHTGIKIPMLTTGPGCTVEGHTTRMTQLHMRLMQREAA